MSDDEQSSESAPKRRRRKHQGAPTTEPTDGSDSSSDSHARRASDAASAGVVDAFIRDLKSPRFLAIAALVVACSVVYTYETLGQGAQPYVLVAVGLSAFALGSASGIDPRHAVGLGGSVVAVGIALVGTSPSQAGAALCLAGGLALAGGIHRLGRMGPEEGGAEAAPSGESFTRAKT